jgi:hypothetical protein
MTEMKRKFNEMRGIFSQKRIIFLQWREGNSDPTQMGLVFWGDASGMNVEKFSKLLNFKYKPEMCQQHIGLIRRYKISQNNNKYRNNFVQYLSPWCTMRNNTRFLDKFFGAGYYSRSQVEIPHSFSFKKKPTDIDILINKVLPTELNTEITKFFTAEDHFNMSGTSKPWLRKVRSNAYINMHRDNWFFVDGLKARERMGEKGDVMEYELWWFCSAYALIQNLWETWERYLSDETDMLLAIQENDEFWGENNDYYDY